MQAPPFTLDETTLLVKRQGVEVRLSAQETVLLTIFRNHPGAALRKHDLMTQVWGRKAEWMDDAALVQLVSRLRRSLAPLGLARAIVTVARIGYRYVPPAQADEPPHNAPRDTAAHAAIAHCVAREGYGEVRCGAVTVRVPQLEYRLLRQLLAQPHAVHDKRTLITLLWPERPGQDDTNLMQVVSRLRRKLIPLGLHRQIVTVPRVGYRFQGAPHAPAALHSPKTGSAGRRATIRRRAAAVLLVTCAMSVALAAAMTPDIFVILAAFVMDLTRT
ncbi:chemotaxis protein CheY [Pandoraea terrae]|uniref:Chemotaxis protein CheY n=1 Tax=Pandoraea terrae TaxID=1537710 RepID=A0A5E4YME6_9BURK|nr:winged helix-turn-helix domain-containing protein [Pandoraea terrae]VVE49595.1 chemotaxis protein CheY [Pandoraea terrae]